MGIIEDMTHIVLNFKGALLRRLTMMDDGHPRDIKQITKMLDITDEMIEKARWILQSNCERPSRSDRLRDRKPRTRDLHSDKTNGS